MFPVSLVFSGFFALSLIILYGEILALAWRDIHFGDTPYLEVTHAVRFYKSKPERSKVLKSKADARKIPLPPELVEVLQSLREQIQQDKAPASVMVVPDTSGNLCTLNAFRNLWNLVERRETVRAQKGEGDTKTF